MPTSMFLAVISPSKLFFKALIAKWVASPISRSSVKVFSKKVLASAAPFPRAVAFQQ